MKKMRILLTVFAIFIMSSQTLSALDENENVQDTLSENDGLQESSDEKHSKVENESSKTEQNNNEIDTKKEETDEVSSDDKQNMNTTPYAAANFEVSTAGGLQGAIYNAKNGQVILVKKDIDLNSTIWLTGNRKITIRADVPTKLNLTGVGSSLFSSIKSGDNIEVVFENITFEYTNSASTTLFSVDKGGMLKLRGPNINANGFNRIISTYNGGDLEVSDTTINNGSITITKDASALIDNVSITKGRIDSASNITIMNSLISQNVVTEAGAAVNVTNGAKLTIDNSKFIENEGRGDGSIIFGESDITITNSRFENNKALHANLGSSIINSGKYNTPIMGTAIRIADTIFENNAGGIRSKGTVKMDNGSVLGSRIPEVADESVKGVSGAAITAYEVIVDGTTFENNEADNAGVIYLLNTTGSSSIKNAIFKNNRALSERGMTAGAIYLQEIIENAKPLIVENTSFEKNSAKLGGAIYTIRNDIVLTDSKFIGNTALTNGGAIYSTESYSKKGGNLTLNGVNEFSFNSAGSAGGAIFMETKNSQFLTNGTTKFHHNSAEKGGAIFAPIVNMSNIEVYENTAVDGGGIYIAHNAYEAGLQESNINLSNIHTNTATKNGGGIYAAFDNQVTLNNTTVASNTASNGLGGGIYMKDFKKIFTDTTTFTNNTASTFSYIKEVDKPTHTSNIVNTTYSSNYENAYNNHDISYESVFHTITFDANGGTGNVDSQNIEHNKKVLDPTTVPTREGYTFKGWYKNKTSNEKWFFNIDVAGQDTKLYAQWEKIKTYYVVTFESDGGSDVPMSSVEAGKVVPEVKNPIRLDSVFEGWYKDSSFTTKWNFATDTISDNMTLYAKWSTAPNTVEVKFNTYGGKMVPSKYVKEQTTVAEPTAPTKRGYIFEGWYTNITFVTKWEFATDKATSDMTLYAKWVKEKYTVTYDQGDLITTDVVEKYDEHLEVPSTPTKPGYSFGGWYVDQTYNTPWYFEIYTIKANMTLHAKWIANPNTYILAFDSKGGSAITSIAYTENDYASIPNNPIRIGYSFQGWYRDEAYTKPWNFANDKVTSNVTIYAKWKKMIFIAGNHPIVALTTNDEYYERVSKVNRHL